MMGGVGQLSPMVVSTSSEKSPPQPDKPRILQGHKWGENVHFRTFITFECE